MVLQARAEHAYKCTSFVTVVRPCENAAMSKLILIDGSSYLYRAFHALPPLTNAQGEPTGALFGVVNMLRSALAARPEYLVFVSDASGPTFRHQQYPQYKAQRPPMPDDLRAQVQPMLDIVAALGVPILRIAGVEADDVIGTLALQAHAHAIEVIISTGDKDLAQLVRPGISLINTMTQTTMDDAAVMAKFGVRPDQIIDFLSLTGDTSDNIPGVPKCGPKTAAKWLAEYQSLDGVIAHAGDIKGKIGESLREALPALALSRQLVTIKTDVPLDGAVTSFVLGEPDRERLRALYTRYGFKQGLRELDGDVPIPAATGTASAPASPNPAPAPVTVQYSLVTRPETLQTWLDKARTASLLAIDTETTGLDSMQAELVGISLAVAPGEACYIPLAHVDPQTPADELQLGLEPETGRPPEQLPMQDVLDRLRPLLESPELAKLGQHAKYDMNILSRYGIRLQGLRHDSMLESYIWNATATRHDMDSLAKLYLGYDTVKFEDVVGKGVKQKLFSQIDLDTASRYASEDADITLRLHQALWPKLESEPALRNVYETIEMPLVPVLAGIEQQGVLIDVEELRRQSSELGKRILELQAKAHAEAGHAFNLDSPKQLQAVLFDELGLEAKLKTPKGQPSTNEEALEAIADSHPLPRLILDYRGLAKLRSTYTEKLPQMVNPHTGRVHTSYHQGAVATGRLSSSDPNLQNIPVRTREGRRIRKAFIAPDGWRIMAADYSQIELRIMAHLSADPGLLAAFKAGEDVHRATAAEVFGVPLEAVSSDQRRAAKAINFGLMYGMGAFGLARQLGVGQREAADYMSAYFGRYPAVRDFMDRTRQDAQRDGYVQTLFGRRLYLPNIKARQQGLRAGAERAAVNAPMQGTAADIIKRAMIKVAAWLQGRDDARMVMQVHDELVFEVRADAVEAVQAAVVEAMSQAAQLEVPLVVDVGIGANWDEAH